MPTSMPFGPRRHRVALATLVLASTSVATWAMGDLLREGGITGVELGVLVLFAVLFARIAMACWTAVLGFAVLARRGRSCIELTLRESPDPLPRTAILLPIFNEDVDRVFASLRILRDSLARTRHLREFDFFVLSDSNDPRHWVAEELAWESLCKEVGGFGRIFYRRRRRPINRKSGGIADFCRRWGRRYRYAVVLDADSVMSGRTLVALVSMMERRPRAGIIQTAPVAVNAESLFARIQQFGQRLAGPLLMTGFAAWQGGDGTYWGHNAILRIAPFMEHCALPRIPGSGVLSGAPLSHDMVEAALMRRAGYEVWLAPQLDGSYEELPPTLLDHLKRDRRWCQGNLQHLRLLGLPRLPWLQRLHLLLGALAYLTAPLWLGFLGFSTVAAIQATHGALGSALFGGGARAVEALGLFAATAAVLLLPRVLGLALVLADRSQRRAFGGTLRLLASTLAELCFSVLIAPVLMAFQSAFVISTCLGRRARWTTQRRAGHRTSLREALRRHTAHALAALAWGTVAWTCAPWLALWLTPVLAGLVLGPALSWLSSSERAGARARRLGLFLTPEEDWPPGEVAALRSQLASCAQRPPLDPVIHAVLDPYANALRVALARAPKPRSPAGRAHLDTLRGRLLTQGPDALSRRELGELLSDARSVSRLHEEAWQSAAHPALARCWRAGLAGFAIVG